MSNRILVTGGAGFIGSTLVHYLVKQGFEVSVLDNLSFGRREHLPPNVSLKKIDLRETQKVAAYIAELQPTIVYHLAALHFIPYCNAHPVECVEVNIIGTRNLYNALVAHPPERLFFASTAAVYPINESANNENSPIGPTDIYGNSKLAGEDLTELFFRRTGVPVIVGRLFNAYGPQETNPHLIPEIIRQVLEGKRELELGNLEPKRNYIYTEDMVAAMTGLMAQSNDMEIYNIASGEEYSVQEVVDLIEEILGEPLIIRQTPERIRKVERMYLRADITRLKEKIGWTPKMLFKNGLKNLLQIGL